MKLAITTAALLLCALAHCVLGAEHSLGAAALPIAPDETTSASPATMPNATTLAPLVPTTLNGTTVSPPVTTTPNGTTVSPPVTTTANATTVVPTSNGTTPEAPTTPAVAPTAAPSGQLPERHFDALSFVGGIILSLGCLAILYVGFKFYKARTERNYHTL